MDNLSFLKLKPLELSRFVMDLLLFSEGDEASVTEPRVRVVWHILFFSMISWLLTISILKPFVIAIFPHSIIAAQIWRISNVIMSAYLLLLLLILTYRHYVYLLSTSKDLQFKNILYFYIIGIILFGDLYCSLWFLSPSLFHINNLPLQSSQYFLTSQSIAFYSWPFQIYSFCVITSVGYPMIQSGATVISILNALQVLFGTAIVVICIATFVQKVDSSKKKRV